MFCNVEGKGVLRSGIGEFLLASEYTPHDELAAEFIRTFRHTFFFGKAYLDRLDDILRKKSEITLERCIPRKRNPTEGPDYVSLYGCRGPDPRAFFVNPWEFVQWWKPIQLQKPSKWYKFTKWTEYADHDSAVPGVGYVLVPSRLQHEDILVLPLRKPASQ